MIDTLSLPLAGRATRRQPSGVGVPPSADKCPEPTPLFVYDGECIMCSGFVRWVLARDSGGTIRVTPAQGATARALYAGLGIPPDRFDTHLLVENGTITTRSDAAIGLLRHLGPGWRTLAGLAALVPRPLRDAAYDWLARNRYRIRGRRTTCWVPDARVLP